MTNKSNRLLDQEMVLKVSMEFGLEWIDSLIEQSERGTKSLRDYRARYVEACKNPDGMSTPVNVLSWTVNEVNNIQRNFRLDLAVNHASAIAIATAQVAQLKKSST